MIRKAWVLAGTVLLGTAIQTVAMNGGHKFDEKNGVIQTIKKPIQGILHRQEIINYLKKKNYKHTESKYYLKKKNYQPPREQIVLSNYSSKFDKKNTEEMYRKGIKNAVFFPPSSDIINANPDDTARQRRQYKQLILKYKQYLARLKTVVLSHVDKTPAFQRLLKRLSLQRVIIGQEIDYKSRPDLRKLLNKLHPPRFLSINLSNVSALEILLSSKELDRLGKNRFQGFNVFLTVEKNPSTSLLSRKLLPFLRKITVQDGPFFKVEWLEDHKFKEFKNSIYKIEGKVKSLSTTLFEELNNVLKDIEKSLGIKDLDDKKLDPENPFHVFLDNCIKTLKEKPDSPIHLGPLSSLRNRFVGNIVYFPRILAEAGTLSDESFVKYSDFRKGFFESLGSVRQNQDFLNNSFIQQIKAWIDHQSGKIYLVKSATLSEIVMTSLGGDMIQRSVFEITQNAKSEALKELLENYKVRVKGDPFSADDVNKTLEFWLRNVEFFKSLQDRGVVIKPYIPSYLTDSSTTPTNNQTTPDLSVLSSISNTSLKSFGIDSRNLAAAIA